MLGPAAASQINQDGGQSVHRRTFQVDGQLIDCHVRISDLEMSVGAYDAPYLAQLGSELSLIGHDAFQDVVGVLTTAVGLHLPDGPPFGGCPLYSNEKHRPELMLALQTTVLSSIFRNYMDNGRRAFLQLGGFYVEPMPTVSQMRLFLFVGSRISAFDVLPSYRQHEPVPGSLLTTPRFLDLNMSFSFRPRTKHASAYSSGVLPDSGLTTDSLGGDASDGHVEAVNSNDSSPQLPPSARLNRRLLFDSTASIAGHRSRLNSTSNNDSLLPPAFDPMVPRDSPNS